MTTNQFLSNAHEPANAVGVMVPGHAGPQMPEGVLLLMNSGVFIGFSMSHHTLDHPNDQCEIDCLMKARKICIRWCDDGDHLPQIDLHSIIMVIEKLT